ncbi:MAG: glycosyltransferase family 4 protein, partial [Promethearchaeota archaeon]
MKYNIKVLFIINSLVYPSGAEYVLYDFLSIQKFLCPYLLFIGNNSESINLFRKITTNKIIINVKRISNLERIRFLRVINYFFLYPILTYFYYLFSKKNEIFNIIKGIDVIYVNNIRELIWIYRLLKRMALNLKIPIILHVHDMVDMYKRRWGFYFELKRALNIVDDIITVSKASKEMLIKFGVNPNKINVVYNGAPIFVEKSCFSPSNYLNIGYIGAFNKRKGIDVLIKAMNSLSYDLSSKINLYFVSKDSEKCITKNLNISKFNKVNLMELKREKLFEFYNKLDLVIVPSRRDPLPTVAIEALGAGVLVIASCVDGIPEIINDNFFLFSVENWKELAKKIIEISELDND